VRGGSGFRVQRDLLGKKALMAKTLMQIETSP